MSGNDKEFKKVETEELRRDSLTPIQCVLECHSLGYKIKKTEILNDVNLAIPPGRLVAFMGPSGAGKTTLLNILAGRGRGNISGEITLDGKPVNREAMRSITRVVPQHDILTSALTAKETLAYTAELALKRSENRAQRVEEVVSILSLESCADVIVGGPDKKGLSGGQIKRVSIGMELLQNPSILLLDEPTSGLDSKVADDVVCTVRKLADDGRLVVCTIHQPSFQLLQRFEWLVMLSAGRIVYNGRVSDISDYLSEIRRPCPTFVNPVDHLIDLLSGNVTSSFSKTKDATIPAAIVIDGEEAAENLDAYDSSDWAELFEKSSQGIYADKDRKLIAARRATLVASTSESSSAGVGKSNAFGKILKVKNTWNSYPTSPWSQFSTIFRRSLYVTVKDRSQMLVRLVQVGVVGILLGTIFLRMPNRQDRANDRLAVIFTLILFLGMSSVMNTALALPVEKAVFLREINNGYYLLPMYYLARVSVLCIIQSIYALVIGIPVYWILNLYPAADRYFIFLAGLVLVSTVAGVIGYTAGVLFPTTMQVSAVVPTILMPMIIFAGFFISVDNIPVYWIWLYYISYFQYAFQILAVNEFAVGFFEPCNPNTTLCNYGGSCSNATEPPQPCPRNAVLIQRSYDVGDLGLNFGILVIFLAFFTCCGGLVMYRFVKRSA